MKKSIQLSMIFGAIIVGITQPMVAVNNIYKVKNNTKSPMNVFCAISNANSTKDTASKILPGTSASFDLSNFLSKVKATQDFKIELMVQPVLNPLTFEQNMVSSLSGDIIYQPKTTALVLKAINNGNLVTNKTSFNIQITGIDSDGSISQPINQAQDVQLNLAVNFGYVSLGKISITSDFTKYMAPLKQGSATIAFVKGQLGVN